MPSRLRNSRSASSAPGTCKTQPMTAKTQVTSARISNRTSIGRLNRPRLRFLEHDRYERLHDGCEPLLVCDFGHTGPVEGMYASRPGDTKAVKEGPECLAWSCHYAPFFGCEVKSQTGAPSGLPTQVRGKDGALEANATILEWFGFPGALRDVALAAVAG